MITPEEVAEICYEANRRLCYSMGNYSVPGWHEAGAATQQTWVGVVEHYAVHGFANLDPNFATPQQFALAEAICKVLIPF